LQFKKGFIAGILIIGLVTGLLINFTFAANDGLYPDYILPSRSGNFGAVMGISGSWTTTILIHSDSDSDVYLTEDSIFLNLGVRPDGVLIRRTDYLESGNFLVRLYSVFKGATLKRLIAEFKETYSKSPRPQDNRYLHPELLKWGMEDITFNLKEKKVEIGQQLYFQRDGDVLMMSPSVRSETGDDYPKKFLFEMSPYNERLAKKIQAALERARKIPEIADRINQMQHR
jgi:hypothetical protein